MAGSPHRYERGRRKPRPFQDRPYHHLCGRRPVETDCPMAMASEGRWRRFPAEGLEGHGPERTRT